MVIIITKPEIAVSAMRSRINELMYSLKLDAVRNREIEALIIERDREVEEAYNFSYGVASYDEMGSGCRADTAFVACEIVALKDNYKKRIQRCRVRHERFKDLVEQLPSLERETLLKAFCTDLEVDERDVKLIIRKHLKLIQSFYPEG